MVTTEGSRGWLGSGWGGRCITVTKDYTGRGGSDPHPVGTTGAGHHLGVGDVRGRVGSYLFSDPPSRPAVLHPSDRTGDRLPVRPGTVADMFLLGHPEDDGRKNVGTTTPGHRQVSDLHPPPGTPVSLVNTQRQESHRRRRDRRLRTPSTLDTEGQGPYDRDRPRVPRNQPGATRSTQR